MRENAGSCPLVRSQNLISTAKEYVLSIRTLVT